MNGSFDPTPFPELKIPPLLPNDGNLVGAAAYDQGFRGETNSFQYIPTWCPRLYYGFIIMVKTICTIGTALMARTLIILSK